MAGTTSRLDVLLVEDNPGDAHLVEHHLDDPAIAHFVDDASVTHVESLAAAEDAVTDADYDVILLDLGLPESEGLETLERAREFTTSEPIIVLTGIDDRETAMEAIERGAQDYLPKGQLDGDRLVRALRYAVVRRRQERSIERRRDQLEFFNGILRHDILNAMSVIMSHSAILEAELEDEQEEHVRTIRKWSDDIVDMTSTVRSVLGTLADQSEHALEPVSLAPVVDDVTERVETMESSGTITADCPPDVAVSADGLLEEVLGNLATNAVEHAGDDPTIGISAERKEGIVRVRITDDGPGIPDDRKKSVFQQGSKGARSSGTGFGLYFVASMVDAYDGDVRVEDAAGGGAAFVVDLPAA